MRLKTESIKQLAKLICSANHQNPELADYNFPEFPYRKKNEIVQFLRDDCQLSLPAKYELEPEARRDLAMKPLALLNERSKTGYTEPLDPELWLVIRRLLESVKAKNGEDAHRQAIATINREVFSPNHLRLMVHGERYEYVYDAGANTMSSGYLT